MSGGGSAGIEPIVSRTEAQLAFAKALRLYVGRGCRHSYKDLQRKSGVPERMIEAYRHDPSHEEHRAAPLEHVLSLAKALGPEFTADWLSLAHQGAFWLPETGGDPLERVAVDAVQDAATLSANAVGGSVTSLREVGSRMMARGANLRALAMADEPDLFQTRRVA